MQKMYYFEKKITVFDFAPKIKIHFVTASTSVNKYK